MLLKELFVKDRNEYDKIRQSILNIKSAAYNKKYDELIDALNIPYQNIEYEDIKSTLIRLYNIKDSKIDKIDEILNYYNFESKYYNEIKEKVLSKKEDFINGKYEYSDKDYDYMIEILNGKFSDNHDEICDDITDILIKAIAEKKVSINDPSSIIEKKTTLIAKKMYGINITVASVYNCEKEECGFTFESRPDTIYINIDHIINDIIDSLNTGIHEATHAKQFDDIFNKKIFSSECLLMIADSINRENSDSYYKDNYSRIYHEIDAILKSNTIVIDFINKNNIKVSNEMKESIESEIVKCQRIVNDKYFNTRVNDGKLVSVFSLLEENIKNKPEYLDMYPQLNVTYKKNEERVERKSAIELLQDYVNYLSGNIQINGNRDEIINYYQKLIKATEEYETTIKEDNAIKR